MIGLAAKLRRCSARGFFVVFGKPDAVSFKQSRLISQNPLVHSSPLDNETVHLNIETGKYYYLNEIGSAIWRLLDTPKSVDEVVACLAKEYDVTLEQCQADSQDLIEYLVSKGVLRAVD